MPNTQDVINTLTTLLNQKQTEVDAVQMALDLVTKGYQSDKDAIAQAKADQKAADLAALQATIAEPLTP